jgi:hypothetical protein
LAIVAAFGGILLLKHVLIVLLAMYVEVFRGTLQDFEQNVQQKNRQSTIMSTSYAVILSANDVRKIGLEYIRSSAAKLSKKLQIEAFVSHYGAPPDVLADQWEELCQIDDPFCRLSSNEKCMTGLKSFLRAHYWVWARPKNSRDFSSHFGEAKWKCERDQLWDWVNRIA